MQTQHEDLLLAQSHILHLEARVDYLVSQNNALQDKLRESQQDIKNLYAENDRLIHTPQFAVDTQVVLDRGRVEGVRSVSNKAQAEILNMLAEMQQQLESIAHRYTRNFAMDLFTGTVYEPEEVKALPDTDFASSLVENAEKI